jgi:hypothetical protein
MKPSYLRVVRVNGEVGSYLVPRHVDPTLVLAALRRAAGGDDGGYSLLTRAEKDFAARVFDEEQVAFAASQAPAEPPTENKGEQ